MRNSKQIIHIEVTSTDSNLRDMGYDDVVEFICELLESETGNWGLSYKPLKNDDYYNTNEIKSIISDVKKEMYYKYMISTNRYARDYGKGASKACNMLLKKFLKIE